MTQSPREAIANAFSGRYFGTTRPTKMADEAIAALAAAEYSVVPTAEYEALLERFDDETEVRRG